MTGLSNYLIGQETLILILVGFSLFTFVASLLLIPWLIIRVPAGYFHDKERPPTPWRNQHPLLRGIILVVKNLLGGVLVILGLLLLILPGQGLLTILAGIILLDFPGKFHFQRWLVQKRPVLRSVNWLRHRGGVRPLEF